MHMPLLCCPWGCWHCPCHGHQDTSVGPSSMGASVDKAKRGEMWVLSPSAACGCCFPGAFLPVGLCGAASPCCGDALAPE